MHLPRGKQSCLKLDRAWNFGWFITSYETLWKALARINCTSAGIKRNKFLQHRCNFWDKSLLYENCSTWMQQQYQKGHSLQNKYDTFKNTSFYLIIVMCTRKSQITDRKDSHIPPIQTAASFIISNYTITTRREIHTLYLNLLAQLIKKKVLEL